MSLQILLENGMMFEMEISITRIKSQTEWPAVSAQVFRRFPVSSCECDTAGGGGGGGGGKTKFTRDIVVAKEICMWTSG